MVLARLDSWAEAEQAGPRRHSQVLPSSYEPGEATDGLSRG